MADAEPAARLGISTPRTTNQDDSAWVSRASGGTTSATTRCCPECAATAPKTRVRACAGAVPPACATNSRRLPPEATSAPYTARCMIPARALAALT